MIIFEMCKIFCDILNYININKRFIKLILLFPLLNFISYFKFIKSFYNNTFGLCSKIYYYRKVLVNIYQNKIIVDFKYVILIIQNLKLNR